MTGFRVKKISGSNLGEQLSVRREQLGISLAQAAAETKVAVHYIAALEQGSYDQLPGEVYARSFLRRYTAYLRLDGPELLIRYESERNVYRRVKSGTHQPSVDRPVERVASSKLIVTPRLLRTISIALLAVVCLAYLGYKVTVMFEAPTLIVELPIDRMVTDQRVIEIVGTTEPETVIKVNGQQILIDAEGRFAESLALQDGTNVIEITAQKKHSRTAHVVRTVVVRPPDINS